MSQPRGARLTRQYNDAECQALLHAVLVDGVKIAEAERRAIDGTLKAGLGPFGRPRFAYSLIRRGREGFEATNDEALAAGTAKALKEAHLANLRALRGMGEDADPAERARIAKALADTQRARGPVAPKGKARPQAIPDEPAAPAGPDTLAQLVKLAG